MTKRICDLEKGDSFMYMGVPCMVTTIKEGRVCYKSHSDNTPSYRHSFGVNCQARVEMTIEKPEEKLPHSTFKKGEVAKTYKIKTKGSSIRNGTQSDGSW